MRRLLLGVIAATAACGGDGGNITDPTGSLEITTITTGAASADFAYSLDGGAATPIGANATVTLADLDAGSHVLRLSNLPEGCTVSGEAIRTVTITQGSTTSVVFEVTCVPPVGIIEVVTRTTGPGPATYELVIDGSSRGPVPANASQPIPDIPSGAHTVGLGGLPANCVLQGSNPQSATVTTGTTTTVTFDIGCTAPPAETGTLIITSTTTGTDPDGFQVAVDGGSPQPIGINATVTIPNVSAGSHTVTLSGLAANCTVSGSNPQTVTVSAGATATVAFAVGCTEPPAQTGTLTITTTTTGTDPDGFQVAVDGGSPQPIGVNATITIPAVAAGPHSVALSGLAANCTVSGSNPRDVTVSAGATATVAFAIQCVSTGPSSKIAFNSNAVGLSVIFVVDPDGTGLVNLTPQGEFDFEPVWSPDAGRILFAKLDGLYVMNFDGSSRTKLTDGEDINQYRWSPDGSRIAFVQLRVQGEDLFEDLWIMQANGSGRTLLAESASEPSWSPDGQRLAFTSFLPSGGTNQIEVINADGTGRAPVTDPSLRAIQPAWSPDGTRIAFVDLNRDILLINPDGTGSVNLTQGRGDDDSPSWSSTGRLVFNTGTSAQPLESEVAVMNSDGSGRQVLTTHSGFDLGGDWSPDGSKIVFSRHEPGESEVYVMNADGTGQLNVSNRPQTVDDSPDWGGGQPPVVTSRHLGASRLEWRRSRAIRTRVYGGAGEP